MDGALREPSRVNARVGAYALVGAPESLLLCRLAVPGPFHGCWTLPGGGMRPGESGPETVVREVREETGLVVEPGPISTAHALWLPGGRSGRLALRLIYPAKVAGGRLRTERNGSTDGCAFFRPEEIAGMRYLDLVDVALGLVAPGLARPQIPAIARGFFDAQGRLTGWPAPRQRTARRAIVEWIASRLPESAVMGEDELRALLEDLHTFGEPSLLRRELMDHGLLRRRGPGSSYVKV